MNRRAMITATCISAAAILAGVSCKNEPDMGAIYLPRIVGPSEALIPGTFFGGTDPDEDLVEKYTLHFSDGITPEHQRVLKASAVYAFMTDPVKIGHLENAVTTHHGLLHPNLMAAVSYEGRDYAVEVVQHPLEFSGYRTILIGPKDAQHTMSAVKDSIQGARALTLPDEDRTILIRSDGIELEFLAGMSDAQGELFVEKESIPKRYIWELYALNEASKSKVGIFIDGAYDRLMQYLKDLPEALTDYGPGGTYEEEQMQMADETRRQEQLFLQQTNKVLESR